MNLIVFHYHFLRGGVTSAIRGSLRALKQTGLLQNVKLHILSGNSNNLDLFLESLGMPVSTVTVDDRMGYRSEPWEDEVSFYDECNDLAEKLISVAKSEPSVFWIHNVTLGKNPLVTASWYRAAEKSFKEGLPCAFLYHIHDFAECGRLENLMMLKRCWKSGGLDDFYPPFPNVSYAVLNKSDAKRLKEAGIPSERVFWIPNAVFVPPERPKLKGEVRKKIGAELNNYARSKGYFHLEGSPYFLMPVRLIRRKNALEGILLSLLYDESPRNVLITLDATSSQERPYAEAVKDLVRTLRLPVIIGFGDELVGRVFPFEDLFGMAECIVTTSLLEGFGFAFLEGLINGCPILGRNLAFVTDDFMPMGFPAQGLYEIFRVPLERKERDRHVESAKRLVNFLGKAFGLEKEEVQGFTRRLQEVYSGELVDFGALDLPAQAQVIHLMMEGTIRREIARVNDFPRRPVRADGDFPKRVEESLGPLAHAKRLHNAISLTLEPKNRDVPSKNISRAIIGSFLDPTYFRPLFGPPDLKMLSLKG